jgi:dihydroorotate dehydrogenase
MLFALEPERVHRLALNVLALAGRTTAHIRSEGAVELMGLRFPNRVGLAAGFDKNAAAVDGLGTLGFGFIEVGTVTPFPQAGQVLPRLFRLPSDGALINRMGFPNDGAAAAAARLRHRKYPGIVGVNIGKNATTTLDRAVDDYVSCVRTVRDVADYIVVNVSSPNTSGLRDLQARERLEPLLSAVLDEIRKKPSASSRPLPLLLKISPDLTDPQLADITDLLQSLSVDGVIATNTTLSRNGLTAEAKSENGGLSGRPLQSLAPRVVASLRASLGPDFPIIGVGGIDSPETALAMRAAGANLVQIYTGFIYCGPGLISQCVRALEPAGASSK